MCNECQSALINEIRLHGITEYEIERHGSHRTLLFTFSDKPMRLVFGTNPSDRRHKENALRDLRHQMGVKRLVTKRRSVRPGIPHPRRRPAAAPALPKLSAPPLPDPWAPLRALAERAPAPAATEAQPPEAHRIRLRCPQFGSRSRWQEAP